MSKSAQDVLSQIKDEGIELIDLKFTDIHGKWQHLTVTSDMIEEDSFSEGLAFDGSSIEVGKQLMPLICLWFLMLQLHGLIRFINTKLSV